MDEIQRMWEGRYASGQESPDGADPHPLVAALLDGRRHAEGTPTALDLGCGSGRHTLALARAGYDTTGVDFSPSAVRIVEAALARHGLAGRAVVGDLRSWTPQRARERGREDVPAEFDLIVAVYFHGDRTLLRRTAEWLAPGGVVLWVTHAPDSVLGPPPGVPRPDMLETVAVLEGKGLDLLRVDEVRTSDVAHDVVVEARRLP